MSLYTRTVKSLLALMLCAACAPAPREVTDASTPDAYMLPPGVWEPDPGLGRAEPSMVSDGADVWFALTRMTQTSSPAYEVWLTKTTDAGEPVLAPVQVNEPGSLGAHPTVAVTSERITVGYVSFAGAIPHVRGFDLSAVPLRPTSHPIPPPSGSGQLHNLQLVTTSGGSLRLIASLEYNDTAELVAIDLDAAGVPTGTSRFLGVADEGAPFVVSAATASDGSSLIAWDRQYDVCTSQKPSVTMAARIDPSGTLNPTRNVPDAAGLSETEPAVASKESTAYIAWVVHRPNRSSIAIARFEDLSATAAETGDPQKFNRRPFIALAAPGQGAIAWSTNDPPLLHIASFRDLGSSLVIDPARVVTTISPDVLVTRLSGLVNVGDDRYVMAWTEEPPAFQHTRLFATTVDFAREASSVPDEDRPAPALPRRQRPCSH